MEEKLKIVLVTDWFSEKMGYSENCLAEALGQLGHEVHLITSTANVYCDSPDYDEVYKAFLGPKYLDPVTKRLKKFTLHRLPILLRWKRIHVFQDLIKTIKKINPDIVQSYEVTSFWALQLSLMQPIIGYKFFTAIHTVASVYPAYYKFNEFSFFNKVRLRLFDTSWGKIVSWNTKICFGATIDASEIGFRFFGVPKSKLKIDPLGVDTNAFSPTQEVKRIEKLRRSYGLDQDDVVCIYTGRFNESKNPIILARAIHYLRKKYKFFKGIFLGSGEQKGEIEKCEGCVVIPFQKYHDLPYFYRMSDIGVWPKQESTSMIDAAATGIPVVVSNRVLAKERIDGNGLTFQENNVEDLALKLEMLKEKKLRTKLGKEGRKKMVENFSWSTIANNRVIEYNK